MPNIRLMFIWAHIQGKLLLHFYASLLSGGQLLKEGIACTGSKFFLLRVNHVQIAMKIVPFVKMAEKHGDVTIISFVYCCKALKML